MLNKLSKKCMGAHVSASACKKNGFGETGKSTLAIRSLQLHKKEERVTPTNQANKQMPSKQIIFRCHGRSVPPPRSGSVVDIIPDVLKKYNVFLRVTLTVTAVPCPGVTF